MLQKIQGPAQPLRLQDRTVLVVGATSGIGAAIATECAAAGAHVVMVGRDAVKLERLAQMLQSKSSGVSTVVADLADFKSVARAAAEIHEKVRAIHIMVANAGLLYVAGSRRLTRDGFELTVGVNHLGNAALILALENLVRNAAPSRIVIVASEAHRRAGPAPLDDFMSEQHFSGLRAYSYSKLANILFARALAQRLQPAGVAVYSAHPGVVSTPILDVFARNAFAKMTMPLARKFMLTPNQAALGILRVAADPSLTEPSGAYFELGKVNPGSPQSNDMALVRRLWDMTLQLLEEKGVHYSG